MEESLWTELVKTADDVHAIAYAYVEGRKVDETEESRVGRMVKFLFQLFDIADKHPRIFRNCQDLSNKHQN